MSIRELFPLESFDDITKRQFHLAYFANLSYQDTENMSRREFDIWYGQLVEQKQEEMESMEDSMDNG